MIVFEVLNKTMLSEYRTRKKRDYAVCTLYRARDMRKVGVKNFLLLIC